MSGKRIKSTLIWIRIVLIMGLIALATMPAFAHSWYSSACCSDQDCAPVPSITVTAGRDGWRVRLRPGDHPIVTGTPIDATVPYDEALPSEDGAFHACVRDQSNARSALLEPIICLYVPNLGGA